MTSVHYSAAKRHSPKLPGSRKLFLVAFQTLFSPISLTTRDRVRFARKLFPAGLRTPGP